MRRSCFVSADAGSDYVDSDTLHMFAACEIERCVNVGIINDDMIEDTEVLNISLGIPSDIRITVNPPEGKIYILDDDSESCVDSYQLHLPSLSLISKLQFGMTLC